MRSEGSAVQIELLLSRVSRAAKTGQKEGMQHSTDETRRLQSKTAMQGIDHLPDKKKERTAAVTMPLEIDDAFEELATCSPGDM